MKQNVSYVQTEHGLVQIRYCPSCKNAIATETPICTICGSPMVKKEIKHPIIDSLCILSLVLSLALTLFGNPLGIGISLVWLIIYYLMNEKIKKDNTLDNKNVKMSMYIVLSFFLGQCMVFSLFL